MSGPLLADVVLSNLLAARLQMAFTLGMHIIVACLGVGLPVLMLAAEANYLRTGDHEWRTLAYRWSKAFAVLFAVGAVSGTVLSFEIPLLWPEFTRQFGAVIGLPFSLEGFAFFVEAIFAGIYIYGWDRLPPRTHWLTGIPVAVSGFMSAWFVVTANAWMNTPQGFRMENGRVVEADPLVAMFNPATGAQTTHMILAAYIVTGFVVAGYYALLTLRGDSRSYVRRAMLTAATLGILATPLQMLSGDWAAKLVARTQPIKLAAMEGHFHSMKWAPVLIGGWPDSSRMETYGAVPVPGMLSFLAYGDPNAMVKGLEEFPRENWPPIPIVHVAFQIMLAAGFALLALSLWAGGTWLRFRQFPNGRLFGWGLVVASPLSVIGMEAGWTVTEVGRQPWIVQGLMRTKDAVTHAPGLEVVFCVTIAIYFVLLAGAIIVLRHLARIPLAGSSHDT